MTARDLPPRRWLVRGALAAVVGLLLLSAAVSAATYERRALGPGTVADPANGSTVVSVQGFHFQGHGNLKKPARLLSAGPEAETQWRHSGEERGATWFYDVDPLPNGTLLVTSTEPGNTVVYEYDPETGERVWAQRFDAADTHDVDRINGDELLVANMRNYDEEAGVSNDRVFVYNLTREEVVWEWRVRDHFPASTAGGYAEDWTHVNDVDRVAEGRYLVSLRNFDQAVVVDRETGEIVERLGSDGDHDTLYEQHNPDYLEGPDGTPTLLVADSENDRVVEYAKVNGSWERTWALSVGLRWPRDADRLPNGNTLVTDTLHHRVIEVTPRGEVVWEYYATWAPYDAERPRHGDGSTGPTMRELGVTGTHAVTGGAGQGPSGATVAGWVATLGKDTPLEAEVTWVADRWAHIAPFVRPVWLPSGGFAATVLAGLVALAWGVGEAVYGRRRLRAAAGRLRERLARR